MLSYFSLFRAGCRIDFGNRGTDRHLGTFSDLDLQDAGLQGRDLRGDLVGIKGEEKISHNDMVSFFFMPSGEDSGGDGFSDGRYCDGNAHDWNGLMSKVSRLILNSEGLCNQSLLLVLVGRRCANGSAGVLFASRIADRASEELHQLG